MVTVATLFTLAMIPIIIATAAFGLAVEGTEQAMKKAGHKLMDAWHRHHPVKTVK